MTGKIWTYGGKDHRKVDFKKIGGKVNSPGFDNSKPLNRFFSSLDEPVNLELPAGDIWCQEAVRIVNAMPNLIGATRTATRIRVAQGSDGMILLANAEAEGHEEKRMDRFFIRDISILGWGEKIHWSKWPHELPQKANGTGLKINQAAVVINVKISNFSANGVEVYGASETEKHNANFFYLWGVEIGDCGGDGIFLTGPDSNAGTIEYCSINDCGGPVDLHPRDRKFGIGVNDRSNLGITIAGVMIHGCKRGFNIGVDQNEAPMPGTKSTLTGCYTETGMYWDLFHGGVTVNGSSFNNSMALIDGQWQRTRPFTQEADVSGFLGVKDRVIEHLSFQGQHFCGSKWV